MKDEEFIRVKTSEGKEDHEISPQIRKIMNKKGCSYEQAKKKLKLKKLFK